MRSGIIVFASIICALETMATTTKAQREAVFVEPTKVSKDIAYQAALGHLAKNLGDSNFAIKVQDKAQGRIITKIMFPCNPAKDNFLVSKAAAEYNLEVETKDKKVRISFEAIEISNYAISGERVITRSVADADEDIAKAAKECAIQLKNTLLEAINGEGEGIKKSENW